MNNKVKLVAIAKDEAAYLVEWIYHHHYFGVDSFDIHVNNTSDNTLDVLRKLKERFDINIIDSNSLYQQYGAHFQAKAYELSCKSLQSRDFSHVGFLDIDEFWTSADFTKSIKDVLESTHQFDVSVFNWVIHVDESEFSRCFKPSIQVINDRHVKCFVKTSSSFKPVIHNVTGKYLSYADCQGMSAVFADETKAKLRDNYESIPSAFILHRLYRSQLEYISALGRGRPSGNRFKNNRLGYYVANNNFYGFVINDEAFSRYSSGLDSLYQELGLEDLLTQAQQYIRNRYKKVLGLANQQTSQLEKEGLVKAFRHINLPEVQKLKKQLEHELLIQTKEENLRKKHIDAIRDAAIFFDKVDDIESAYALMNLAHQLRPEGKLIEQKLKEFEQKRSINA